MVSLLGTFLTDSNDSNIEGPSQLSSSAVVPLLEASSNRVISQHNTPPKKPANFVPPQPLSADRDDDKFIDIIEHYFQDLNDESGFSSSSAGIPDSTLLSSSAFSTTSVTKNNVAVDSNNDKERFIEITDQQDCRESNNSAPINNQSSLLSNES